MAQHVRITSGLPLLTDIACDDSGVSDFFYTDSFSANSKQPIEKVHALSLMEKRAHSDADIRGSRRRRARRPNKNGLMGTSAVCRRSVAIFSRGNGAPEEIQTPTPDS